jgi:hypothetical protein
MKHFFLEILNLESIKIFGWIQFQKFFFFFAQLVFELVFMTIKLNFMLSINSTTKLSSNRDLLINNL